eukprot:1143240-Rhodomonas_salina.1
MTRKPEFAIKLIIMWASQLLEFGGHRWFHEKKSANLDTVTVTLESNLSAGPPVETFEVDEVPEAGAGRLGDRLGDSQEGEEGVDRRDEKRRRLRENDIDRREHELDRRENALKSREQEVGKRERQEASEWRASPCTRSRWLTPRSRSDLVHHQHCQ